MAELRVALNHMADPFSQPVAGLDGPGEAIAESMRSITSEIGRKPSSAGQVST